MGSAAQDMTNAAQYPEGDVVRTLLEQHARIKTLFADIRGAGGDVDVIALFAELRAMLAVHETAEQLVVRPVTMHVAGNDIAHLRTSEEAEASRMLKELEKIDPLSPEFGAELSLLERAVNDHAEAEEKTEFPALLAGCTAEQRRTMGQALMAAERVAPTHPHPKLAGNTAATLLTLPLATIIDRTKDAIRHAS